MKIVDVKLIKFRKKTWLGVDRDGHMHPSKEKTALTALLEIVTDDGFTGRYFTADNYLVPSKQYDESALTNLCHDNYVPVGTGDSLRDAIEKIKPVLIGEDPFCRERIYKKLFRMQRLGGSVPILDEIIGIVDCALWDLAGQYANLPVYKLLGGHRTRIPAYGSIMVGDDYRQGLGEPEDYGNYAKQLKDRGYRGIKLHTWMDENWSDSVISGKPALERDMEACRAVRAAVGDDMPLFIDGFHDYTRFEALKLGRELEKLHFEWIEEPMDEYNLEDYKWLADQLDIPVIGPETAKGKSQTRLQWILNGACDICRAGVMDVGGITQIMKTIHMCEIFGVPVELHSPGAATLHVMAAMMVPGKYYERGLLHPFLDYDVTPPWFHTPVDLMDEDGLMHVSDRTGLGYDINWDYIRENQAD